MSRRDIDRDRIGRIRAVAGLAAFPAGLLARVR
jgi:hypothetical protein